jgi:hypothetical protein
MRYILGVLFFGVVLLGCSDSKTLEIKGLDSDGFKEDRGGCNGSRKGQLDLIKNNKDAFLGISENELFKYIGRYDYQVLDKKNEKVFVYYLEPGNHCQYMQNSTDAESIVFYINAVKLVKQVVIQKGGHEAH